MDIQRQIADLKEERDAILLVHNYQRPEIQDLADYIGDSLGLSLKATEVEAENIIFCGVDFMAESAKVLNPYKNVIHPIQPPSLIAKCPMAAMVDVEGLRRMREEHPDAAVVSYVNTTADVKAESDICCTSSNAVKVVQSLKEKRIIFVPDMNLGMYVQRFINNKEIILWPGYCRTHIRITTKDIIDLKVEHPKAEVIVHPECTPDVIDLADKVASTEGIVKAVRSSPVEEFIIGTERELIYRLKKENSNKTFYVPFRAICPNMKQIWIENVLKSLKTLEPKIKLSEDIMRRARTPLEKMVKIGRGD